MRELAEAQAALFRIGAEDEPDSLEFPDSARQGRSANSNPQSRKDIAGAVRHRRMISLPDTSLNYTNTSPGKAVNVRDASVFSTTRFGRSSRDAFTCLRSMRSFNVRSMLRRSRTSAPVTSVDARPCKPARPVRPTR